MRMVWIVHTLRMGDRIQKLPESAAECIVYTECDAERTAGYEPDDKEDGSDGTVQDASARRRMGRVLQKMRRCSRGMV